MSGAYVGIQRAKQQAQSDIQQRAALDAQRAKAEEERAHAEYWKQAGQFQGERGDLEREKNAAKQAEQQNKLVSANMMKGIHTEFDAQGKATQRPFTQAEIDADPTLKTQQKKELAYTNAAVARATQGALRLQLQNEELNFKKHKLDVDASLKSRQLDIAGKKVDGSTLPTPAKKTLSLTFMAEDYISKMEEIAKAHPEGFGQSGWGDNNFKKALGEQQPWAVQYASYAKYAALPFLGIHNSRAAALAKDMEDWNSNMYQDSNAVMSRLAAAHDVAKTARADTIKAYTMKADGSTATPEVDDPLGVLPKKP
jgi:hypothetical protein